MGVELDWPLGRLPAYLIVDDGAPVYNLDRFEFPGEPHLERIPNAFVAAFVEAVVRRGVRGKFTVLPYPMGLGRIDQGLPGVAPRELDEFMTMVGRDIAPSFDITPEILTHLHAMDIDHGWAPLPYDERRMIPHHSEESLAAYFEAALGILANVGLQARGLTSPGDFGVEAEEMYARAVASALGSRDGRTVPFYFLHVDRFSPVLVPRVWAFETGSTGNGADRVSVQVPSGGGDAFWPTKYAQPATTDRLIDPSCETGRLVSLVMNRSPLGFHTHWQSLFSNGSREGLRELEVLLDRLDAGFAERIAWTRCSDLAASAAARASAVLSTRVEGSTVVIDIDSPYAAPDFTVRVTLPVHGRAVRVDGRGVLRAASPSKERYWAEGGATVVAWDLRPGHHRVEMELGQR